MWYELFVITASGLGVAIFLIYLLASRIPTQEDLIVVGTAIIDAKLKEFQLTPPRGGGRPNEGMLDRLLAIPAVQGIISQVADNFMKQQGGLGYGP